MEDNDGNRYVQYFRIAITILLIHHSQAATNITDLSDKNLTAVPSGYVHLTCRVADLSINYIDWYSNGKNITHLSGGRKNGSFSVWSLLQVTYNADDIMNTYQCTNQADFVSCQKTFECRVYKTRDTVEASKNATVRAQIDYPTAPLLFVTFYNSTESVTLEALTKSELKPSQAKVQHEINYWDNSTNKTVTMPTMGNSPMGLMIFSGVRSSLQIRVRGVNKLRNGPWNRVLYIENVSQDPPSAPNEIKTSNVTSDRMLLSWTFPSNVTNNCVNSNGPLSSASTTYEGVWENTTAKSTTTTSFTFKSLIKNGIYQIHVRLPEVPATPLNLQATPKNSTSVQLSWDLPPEKNRNGIRGFRIWRCKTSNCLSPTVKVYPDASTVKITISNLAVFTNYTFKVRTYNGLYDSTYKTVTALTHEEAPSAAPANFQLTANTTTSFSLSWELPPVDKRNGIIIGFKVSYCNTSSCSSPTVEDYKISNTLVYTLGNLTVYTEYNFKVLAYNSRGDGPFSNDVKKRTLGLPPTPPRNVRLSTIAPVGSVGPKLKVTWIAPDRIHEALQGYKVSYTMAGDSNYKTTQLGPNTLTFELPVRGDESYIIIVWAFSYKEGSKEEKNTTIEVFAPPAPSISKTNRVTEFKSSGFTIILWKISSVNGPISAIFVYVHIVKSDSARKKRSNGNIKLTCSEIASKSAKLPPNATNFTIGDGLVYGSYKNEKLKEGQQYEVYQCGLTQKGQQFLYGGLSLIAKGKIESSGTETQSSLTLLQIVLIVVLIFFVLLIVILIVMVVYIRNFRTADSGTIYEAELEYRDGSANQGRDNEVYSDTSA